MTTKAVTEKKVLNQGASRFVAAPEWRVFDFPCSYSHINTNKLELSNFSLKRVQLKVPVPRNIDVVAIDPIEPQVDLLKEAHI